MMTWVDQMFEGKELQVVAERGLCTKCGGCVHGPNCPCPYPPCSCVDPEEAEKVLPKEF